jgi:hypothetical protein
MLNSLWSKIEKYNNRLILSLSMHPTLRRAFISFSEEAGEEYIDRSNVKDKRFHAEALLRYRELFMKE